MKETLSQLLPFNQHRFDACLTYLMREHGKPLTQYDIVKLHVMTDVFHVLEHGTPVIGGELSPWEHGPLVKRAYDRIMGWWRRVKETDRQPAHFHVEHQANKRIAFSATDNPDYDDLSESEIEAMDRAWNVVMTKDWESLREYFHDPDQFMGYAWSKAKADKRGIDWDDIIDAYDRLHKQDHSHIKRAMRL